jgi:hypothetical protein
VPNSTRRRGGRSANAVAPGAETSLCILPGSSGRLFAGHDTPFYLRERGPHGKVGFGAIGHYRNGFTIEIFAIKIGSLRYRDIHRIFSRKLVDHAIMTPLKKNLLPRGAIYR